LNGGHGPKAKDQDLRVKAAMLLKLRFSQRQLQCERRSTARTVFLLRVRVPIALLRAKFLFTRPPFSTSFLSERTRWSLLRPLAQHGFRYFLRFVA
jgi:hypothetical protein